MGDPCDWQLFEIDETISWFRQSCLKIDVVDTPLENTSFYFRVLVLEFCPKSPVLEFCTKVQYLSRVISLLSII